jgi:hypothetical protein
VTPGPNRISLSRPELPNVVDEARFALAEHYLSHARTDEAVALLEKMAEESPDERARSAAQFNVGRVYEEALGDSDRARAAYARVGGRWATSARSRVVGPLRREGRWGEAVAFLRDCVAAAGTAEDKAGAVRMLVSTVRASGDDKLIESTLASVTEIIAYEEAEAAAEIDRKKMEAIREEHAERRAAERRRPALPGRPDFSRRGELFRPGGAAGRGRAAAGAEPEESEARARIEAEIRELEAAGFEDQARELREKLESGGDEEATRF